jgi:hypothetical protein
MLRNLYVLIWFRKNLHYRNGLDLFCYQVSIGTGYVSQQHLKFESFLVNNFVFVITDERKRFVFVLYCIFGSIFMGNLNESWSLICVCFEISPALWSYSDVISKFVKISVTVFVEVSAIVKHSGFAGICHFLLCCPSHMAFFVLSGFIFVLVIWVMAGKIRFFVLHDSHCFYTVYGYVCNRRFRTCTQCGWIVGIRFRCRLLCTTIGSPSIDAVHQ